MIGWTLGRYFFTRYLATVAWLVAGVVSLVFIVTFTQVNDRFSGLAGYTVGTGLKVAALQAPMILQQTLPFVGLFASMAMLIQLNRKYELVIARSAGLSAWQFLMPICAGALVFGVLAILAINPLAIITNMMMA